MTAGLFESIGELRPAQEEIAEGAFLLRGFAIPFEDDLVPALREIIRQALFPRMHTPGGHQMSVAMTSGGKLHILGFYSLSRERCELHPQKAFPQDRAWRRHRLRA